MIYLNIKALIYINQQPTLEKRKCPFGTYKPHTSFTYIITYMPHLINLIPIIQHIFYLALNKSLQKSTHHSLHLAYHKLKKLMPV